MALAGADEWATRWPAGALSAAQRARMRSQLRADALDLVQLYVREGGRWRLAEQVVAEKLLGPEGPDFADRIGAALDSSRLLHTPRGALAAVARVGPTPAVRASNGPERAVVVGMLVPNDFFEEVDRIGEGLSHYRQLGVLVDVQRRFVWLLVAAGAAAVLRPALFPPGTPPRPTPPPPPPPPPPPA